MTDRVAIALPARLTIGKEHANEQADVFNLSTVESAVSSVALAMIVIRHNI